MLQKDFRCNLVLTHIEAMRYKNALNLLLAIAFVFFGISLSVNVSDIGTLSSEVKAQSNLDEVELDTMYCRRCEDCSYSTIGAQRCNSQDGCFGGTCMHVIIDE